jgi:Uma2 family endonuclease
MVDSMLDPAQLGPETVRPLLRREYEQLVAHGSFVDEHVELLRGVLVAMSPQGDAHARISAWFAQRLIKALDMARFDVRSHSPFAATTDSMPEPDVSVARRTLRGNHPTRALLLIEVCGSSARKDRSIKTEIYAEAGVPEYWIVDLDLRAVDVLTRPTSSGYARTTRIETGSLHPTRLRAFAIALADVPWRPRVKRRKRVRST